MFPRNFYKSVKALMLEGGKDVLADANYPASTAYIDTNGYDHVVFLVGLDTIATPDFQVKQDKSATETADIKNLTGAAKTDVVTGDDGKWFTIEFPVAALDAQNGFRYVTLAVSGTGGADNANIWCFLYRARELPVTQDANYDEGVILGG